MSFHIEIAYNRRDFKYILWKDCVYENPVMQLQQIPHLNLFEGNLGVGVT